MIALALVATMLFAFCGCVGKKEGPQELFSHLFCALELEERCALYTEADGREGQKATLRRIYGREDAHQVFSSVSHYAIALSKKDEGVELHMLKVRHPSDIESVKRLLRGRIELLQTIDVKNYLGVAYEKALFSARLYQKGSYLFLLATRDNDGAIKEIDKIF